MGKPPILDGLAALRPWLSDGGAQRVLLITTPARRFVSELPLVGLEVEVFDRAAQHVPRALVDEAREVAARCEPDTIIALGGGSATGLAKALRLELDARFVAIPTTYAGSEMTDIYGVLEGDEKKTGRDERVRPDAVVHDPSLFRDLPLSITTASLLNALAHPVSALSTEALDATGRERALRAIERLGVALDQVLESPTSLRARALAITATAAAGAVLDGAPLGVHHQVAHRLGGAFALGHAGVHSVLLPHLVRHLHHVAAPVYDAIREAYGHPDVPARLYDALTRAGAARSLTDLGVSHAALEALATKDELLRANAWVTDALYGQRPSIHQRRQALEGRPDTWVIGAELEKTKIVVVALHGRSANAGRMLDEVATWIGHDPGVTIVALQGPKNEWYATSYRAPAAEMGSALDASLRAVEDTLRAIVETVPPSRVFLAGFSQGACLATEAFARTALPLGGLLAMAGARIGPSAEQPAITRRLEGARVVLGASEHDRWLTAADIRASAEGFRQAGAEVTLVMSPGDAHEITLRQRMAAQRALFGRRFDRGPRGFGNAHEVELLEGALPRRQNSPRRPAYGLHAEQINGTGFIAPRRENLRTWFYRIRPSAQHTPFVPAAHPRLLDDWDDTPPEPNLIGFAPVPEPDAPADFVDGLATVGGAGHPRARRGYALHVYAANRSMTHRAFTDADGDLLIVPQRGRLVIQTELGLLPVGPGEVATVPRGLRFSVHLEDERARGWVGEVYGRHFALPERGPLGANGLADPRHFRAPEAFFEDRIDPGYRVTTKHQNALFEATQDHSPYDVVAWHGTYVPYAFDLMDFSPAGNTRFDHTDPSVHLVLSAPLDEHGADALDFLFFPPRWDPSEHTFRPPYFHRNAIVEINGIIDDPTLSARGPFEVGCTFITPPMTPHGVLTHAVEAELRRDESASTRPVRIPDSSKWFQLESVMPFGLTSWARGAGHRVADWPDAFGAYRAHFDPHRSR